MGRDGTGREKMVRDAGQDGTLKKELSGTGRDEFLVIPRSSDMYIPMKISRKSGW